MVTVLDGINSRGCALEEAARHDMAERRLLALIAEQTQRITELARRVDELEAWLTELSEDLHPDPEEAV